MRLACSLVAFRALAFALVARADPAPLPELGTLEWRDVERSFGDFCRRNPSKACRELMKAFRRRPGSIEMRLDFDLLVVKWGSHLYVDYFELGECHWDGNRWLRCRIVAGGFQP